MTHPSGTSLARKHHQIAGDTCTVLSVHLAIEKRNRGSAIERLFGTNGERSVFIPDVCLLILLSHVVCWVTFKVAERMDAAVRFKKPRHGERRRVPCTFT